MSNQGLQDIYMGKPAWQIFFEENAFKNILLYREIWFKLNTSHHEIVRGKCKCE